MGSPAAPPPAARGKPLQRLTAWVKKNKAVAAIVGGGGLMLFLSAKGGSGDAGGDPASSDAATYGQLVPVMQATDPGDTADPLPADEPAPVPDPPEPVEPAPKPTPAPVPGKVPAAPGVTLHGKTFAGATGYRFVQTKNGSHGGQYVIYAVTYPGKTEYWWYYTRGNLTGRWTGPHHQPGTTPRPDAPAPKPKPKPKPATGDGPKLYAGHPLAYWHDPSKSRRNGKWQWPSAPGKYSHTREFKP